MGKAVDSLVDSFRRWKNRKGPQVVFGRHENKKYGDCDLAFASKYYRRDPDRGNMLVPDDSRAGDEVSVYNPMNQEQFKEELYAAGYCPEHFVFTEQLTQAMAVLGVVVSTNHANGNDNTITAINAGRLRRYLGLAEMGLSNAAGNNQVTWQNSATSGGTYANVGSTVTLNVNNTCGTVEIRADQLASGTQFLQLNLLITGGPAFGSIWALGGESSYKPGNQFDASNTNGVQNGGPTRVVG